MAFVDQNLHKYAFSSTKRRVKPQNALARDIVREASRADHFGLPPCGGRPKSWTALVDLHDVRFVTLG